jgi:outer membrane receptor protein involved in Fe transport
MFSHDHAAPAAKHRRGRRPADARVANLVAIALCALCVLGSPAHAQRVTGTVQGKIVKTGEPQAGAKVTATNLTNGAVLTVDADAAGGYRLPSLAPGQYLIAVAADGHEATEFIDVGIGQDLQVNLDVASGTMAGTERIEVSAQRFENKTSEVAINVTREQIANLPQNSRNFLNFAQLAPGVQLNTDPQRQNFSSGGMPAPQTNVFIDGLSLKNNINDGGVAGQDASRGNPFPQLAVAGFRVLTQNYKAEYEQAGSAIISTVTRSGGNEPHGDLYFSYQDRRLVAIDPFAEKLMQDKPDYSRYQLGGLLSGPIIKDKLFALATYEGNYQNRANQVVLNNSTPENLERFGQYQGSFGSPFREHLGFGKLSWLPDPDQTVDLSLHLRRETDIRSFGAQTGFEAAENVRNNIFAVQLRHQWRLPSLVNEANVQFLNTQFNPGAENPDLIGRDFAGVIKIGGRDTDQDVVQRTIMLRDDISLPAMTAAGEHHVKFGAKLAFQHYKVERLQFGNPLFRFRIDPINNLDFDIPYEAQFGVGNPEVDSNNTQIGLYGQDDWAVNERLTLNLGVRWDIETNPLNNDYVTPADVRAAVTELAATVAERNGTEFFPVDNYLTDGSQRPIYFGEIQPRLGASYDITGDGMTVAFGGAGRYYDRTLFNSGVDERYRLQYAVRTFRFSRDGMPRDGQPTIMFDPSYQSRAGLQGLIESGVAPNPEIFLLENDTRPVYSDQYSLGVRQQIGPVNASLTFSHIRSQNGLGFYPANRDVSGNRDFLPVPGNFGNVLISVDDIESRFNGFYLVAEKPYSEASKWGASATYTLGWAKIRGDSFNFDFPTVKATPLTPGNDDERQRLVLSAMGGLPYGVMISTLIQLGTGKPFNVIDNSAGFDARRRFQRNGGRADPFIEYKQVDLRIAKRFEVAPKQYAAVFAEAFNLFNWYNYKSYDGNIPAEGMNPNFGKPSEIVGPTRSLQFGVTYGF